MDDLLEMLQIRLPNNSANQKNKINDTLLLIESRAEQVFETIKQNPANLKVDYVFIKYLEIIKDLISKANKIISEETERNKELKIFLTISLSEFNQTPPFTDFTFDNDKFVKCFSEILVEGAVIYSLAPQILKDINDGLIMVKVGTPDYPPTPADLEQWRKVFDDARQDNQYSQFKIFTHSQVEIEEVGNSTYRSLINLHRDKLKEIKSCIHEFKGD